MSKTSQPVAAETGVALNPVGSAGIEVALRRCSDLLEVPDGDRFKEEEHMLALYHEIGRLEYLNSLLARWVEESAGRWEHALQRRENWPPYLRKAFEALHPPNDQSERTPAMSEQRQILLSEMPCAPTGFAPLPGSAGFFQWWDDCGFARTHPDEDAFVMVLKQYLLSADNRQQPRPPDATCGVPDVSRCPSSPVTSEERPAQPLPNESDDGSRMLRINSIMQEAVRNWQDKHLGNP